MDYTHKHTHTQRQRHTHTHTHKRTHTHTNPHTHTHRHTHTQTHTHTHTHPQTHSHTHTQTRTHTHTQTHTHTHTNTHTHTHIRKTGLRSSFCCTLIMVREQPSLTTLPTPIISKAEQLIVIIVGVWIAGDNGVLTRGAAGRSFQANGPQLQPFAAALLVLLCCACSTS